uniref:Uncharacterized protein n=1 Tax=Anguilla anguilla TaxID=7936 RepID=A0A0E9TRE8_ANGAN
MGWSESVSGRRGGRRESDDLTHCNPVSAT